MRPTILLLLDVGSHCHRHCLLQLQTDRAGPAASPAAAPVDDRRYALDQVDDAAVAQLYADGFSLPLREKTLVWHLYQAAIAGRDIFLDQKHKDALEMRGVLEQIVAHSRASTRRRSPRSSATRSCSGSTTALTTT